MQECRQKDGACFPYFPGVVRPSRRADLAKLAGDPGLDTDLRRAAAWWLAIPEAVQRSVLA